MQQCKEPGCETRIQSKCGLTLCRKHRAERALDKPPSQRTREELESVVAALDSRITCLLAQREANQAALAKLPVAVDPEYLNTLEERSNLLSQIENAVAPNVRPGQPIAQSLIDYLKRSCALRGVRF